MKVKQSTLQKMLFTDNGFEIVEDKDDLEKRINFSKSLLNLQFTGHGIQGYEFTLFDDDLFSDALYSMGFRVYKDYSMSSLEGIKKDSGSIRHYFFKPTKEDFKSMKKWPYKITLSNKYCYYTLYFKTEEDYKHFDKELYPKYKVQLQGGKVVYCKNCGNFTFLTPPLQYHYNIKEKEEKNAPYRSLIRAELADELYDKILNIILIEKRYRDKDFSAKELAKELNTNTRYISAVINSRFNTNFSCLINEYRIKEAMHRMTDKRYADMTIEEIGKMVGFANRQSFYASFYRMMKETPNDYRKRHTTVK